MAMDSPRALANGVIALAISRSSSARVSRSISYCCMTVIASKPGKHSVEIGWRPALAGWVGVQKVGQLLEEGEAGFHLFLIAAFKSPVDELHERLHTCAHVYRLRWGRLFTERHQSVPFDELMDRK